MEYEGQICRTPQERASFMLPVSVGCPYNRCKFCGLFKHLSYRELPLEQIKADVDRVAKTGRSPRSVMLGDGNAFGLPTETLIQVLEYLDEKLPHHGPVSADATISSIAKKSNQELAALAQAGLTNLYIGIESGLDDVLRFMQKEHNNTQAKAQIERLHTAGINFGAHIMCGIAGAGRGEENAYATADLLNELKPTYICNFSMFIHQELELGCDVKAGAFKPASEQECLQEERTLIERLNIPVRFDGFNDSVEFRVLGQLPEDASKLIARIDHKRSDLALQPPLYSLIP